MRCASVREERAWKEEPDSPCELKACVRERPFLPEPERAFRDMAPQQKIRTSEYSCRRS